MKKSTKKNKAAAELGKRGGEARAKNMTKKERSEAARQAALSRWKRKPQE
jgi:hypothetical protein